MINKQKNFEENMEQLEIILSQLQDESTGLEHSLELYRDAAALLTQCHQTLQSAKIEMDEITVSMQEGNS